MAKLPWEWIFGAIGAAAAVLIYLRESKKKPQGNWRVAGSVYADGVGRIWVRDLKRTDAMSFATLTPSGPRTVGLALGASPDDLAIAMDSVSI